MTSEPLTSAEREVLDRIDHLLGDRAVWEPADMSLPSRVVAAIDAEREAAIAAPASPVPARPARPRRRWLALAGAAVLGAAAATTVAVVLTRSSEAEPEAAFPIVGTALAPGLSGSVKVNTRTSGVEIEITMPGLPRRDGGQYYELWMHSCDGSRWVPAGTFHDTGYVVGWAGVSIHDYPVLKVTREAVGPMSGAAQGPSKDVVAGGSLGSCTS